MRNEKLEIDKERGVLVVCGEEYRLARGYDGKDRGRFFVYADVLEPDKRYDVVVFDDNGDVTMVWVGYYKPSMFALKIYPVWDACGKKYKPVFIAERMVKLRKISDDAKP